MLSGGVIVRTLIVEDDFGARTILKAFLSPYSDCDIAVDGNEAIEAFRIGIENKKTYDLICLDIMMPNMDGRDALKKIRAKEEENGMGGIEGVKIIMTSALDEQKSIVGSFLDQCEAYLVKPIKKEHLVERLQILGLIS